MTVIECDVLVVGAGPAGLVPSVILSNKGHSVCILEKNQGSLSNNIKFDITEGQRIKNINDEIGIKENKKSNISEWFSPNHKFILESNIDDLYFKRGYDNDSLENKLISKIKKEKVRFFYKTKINSFKYSDNKITDVEIISDNKKYTINPKFLIISDGPESATRNKLKIKTHIYAKFIGYGMVIHTKKNNYISHTKIYFDQNLAPGGYLYSGSVGKETFFCIVADKKIIKTELIDQKLKSFINEKIKDKYKQISTFKGTGISGLVENNYENVFFTGGAALLNDPFLAYGLNYAIESAYYAAKAINNNKASIYTQYLKEIQNNFKDMSFSRKIWRNADNKFFDKLIKAFNGEYDMNDEKINSILELFDEK